MKRENFPKTQFFQACRGVFEGGGCRGAAHVGAYEAAICSGVNFSEVAGTSAGALVAALIGAGATPDYLLRTVACLQFSTLLSEPKGQVVTPWWARLFGRLLRGSKRLLGKVAEHGSAYSSERIEQWVDDRLAELLPQAPRPIKFKDLITPTWIVATDLSGRRAKVWSTQDTPDENVGFAVRCSCSIPLFFEPVQAGLDRYVDGGMLSNLPAFVFAQRKNPLALGGRILAFELVDEAEPIAKWSIDSLVRRLIDTAISGATSVQRGLVRNVSTVRIDTGRVSSTNFNISKGEIATLVEAGRSAMRRFVVNEHVALDDDLASDVARYGKDELYDDLTREMTTCGRRLLVACQDTRWYWDIFPSVASWAFGGAAIEVLVAQAASDGRERQRRSAMQRLGIRIHQAEKLPFSGFILEREDDRHNSAFITDISQTQFSPTGAVYVGAKHRPVIKSLAHIIEQAIGPSFASTPGLILKPADPQRLIHQLRQGVHQYADRDIAISLEPISLESEAANVQLIVRRIRSFKYRQIEAFAALHDRFGIQFGAPADIYADDTYVSTITPPVLELWGNDLVAVEGNTRLFYMNRIDAAAMHGFVVRGVAAPLPGIPVAINEALISTYQLSPEERMRGFRYENFRSIEGSLRPEE